MTKKRTILLIVGAVLIVFFSLSKVLYDHVHYNHSKENIFEIPGTCDIWKSGNTIRYEKYYFIQNSPNSEKDLEKMIIDYINQNKVLENAAENGADYVALSFMIPDFNLPIYFEENKSYFKMDDHIKNYIKTNRIALYTYNYEYDESNLSIKLR
jgi:hypothetical protein